MSANEQRQDDVMVPSSTDDTRGAVSTSNMVPPNQSSSDAGTRIAVSKPTIVELQRVLDELKKAGDEDPTVADLCCSLAAVLRGSGDTMQAEPLLARAVEIRTHWFGAGSQVVGWTLEQLAQVQELNHNLSACERSYRSALDVAVRHLGAGSSEAKDLVEELRRVLAMQHRPETEADKMAAGIANTAMNDAVEAFPWDHYREMGQSAMQIRNYKEAERAFTVLRDVTVALSPNSVHYAQSMELLSEAYHKQRKDENEIFRLRDRALSKYQSLMGEQHPSVARHLARSAEIRVELGQLEEARVCAEKAVSIFEKCFSADHEELKAINNRLADINSKLTPQGSRNTPEFAKRRMERMLAHRPAALAAANNAMDETGQLASSVATEVPSRSSMSVTIADTSESVDQALWQRFIHEGKAALVSGNHSEAENLFTLAIEQSAQHFGENDSRHLDSMCHLASVHTATGKFYKATSLYHKVLSASENLHGAESPNIVRYLVLVAKNFEEQGDLCKEQECYERIVRIYTAASVPAAVIEPYQAKLDQLLG